MEITQETLKEVVSSLKAAKGTPDARKQVWAAVETCVQAVRRVEAAHTIQGFWGGSGISLIESVLDIATPVAALYSDFELSNLLGSLRVWLEKKKLEERQEQINRDRMMNQGVDDLTFTYQM